MNYDLGLKPYFFRKNHVIVCTSVSFSLSLLIDISQSLLASHPGLDMSQSHSPSSSLSLSLSFYLSLSLSLSLCLSMSLYVSLCLSMSLYVSLCLSMSLYVSLCLSMSLSLSLKGFPLKPVPILKHATRISTEQTSMRTKWSKHITI